jgi:copper(I)-binding protein
MRITARESDVLVRASTTAAQAVEMHRSSVEDGVARMRRIDALAFKQQETVAFEPGGTHFMLIGLRAPLADGQQLPFELEFKNVGKIAANVPVMARSDDHAHH